jgi:hypothetical protein
MILLTLENMPDRPGKAGRLGEVPLPEPAALPIWPAGEVIGLINELYGAVAIVHARAGWLAALPALQCVTQGRHVEWLRCFS